MKHFEEFLHKHSSQTSLSCLLDSLENRKKSSLTFKDAVKTTELMACYIEQLASDYEKKENENKNLKAQLKEAKEYLKSDFRL